jgi:histidinol dehydrogenase
MKTLRVGSQAFEQLCRRGFIRKPRIETAVTNILNDVRAHGDEAVIKYTRKFDGVKLTPKQLRVTELEIGGAFQHVDPGIVSHLKTIIHNIESYYRKVRPVPSKAMRADGIRMGEKIEPLERVGIYVPAGTAPLVSTVYMTVVPAKLAGVERIILVCPPNKHGTVDPHVLAVANLLKVNEIYKVGGAQAIGALAFGTKTIPRVDKIVGPGNLYVTEAKRQVFGQVDIDLMAGPSEVAVLADRSADPKHVIAELRGEAEHVGGLCVLVTSSKALAKQVTAQVKDGYCVVVKSLTEAIAAVNTLAPEHVHVNIRNPQRVVRQIRNAGAIFLGTYSPTSVGDYIAGPSHVLPTGGTGRMFSGLGIEDFVRHCHYISYSRKALERVAPAIQELATLEGLPLHYESVKARLESS